MLINNHHITIARFLSPQEIDAQEVAQADLVQFETFVPGLIYHSTQLNWKGNLSYFSSPYDFIRSKREKETVEQSRSFFREQGYELKIVKVNDSVLEDFLKVYQETTLKKDHAIDFNARLIVKKNLSAKLPVYLFGLYRGNQLESGLIGTTVKDEFRVMFGAKKRFDEVRGGIGGVLEVELLEYCFQNNINQVSHGLSSNPAGIVDQPGIFEFKTRYGFTAFPLGSWYSTAIVNPEKLAAELIFLSIKDNQLVYKVLGNDSEHVKKYASRLIPHVHFENLEAFVQYSNTFLHS